MGVARNRLRARRPRTGQRGREHRASVVLRDFADEYAQFLSAHDPEAAARTGLPGGAILPDYSPAGLVERLSAERFLRHRVAAVPFIHPFTEAVQLLWQSRSDWEIYKGLAKKFSELVKDYLGVRKDIVLTPLMHDSPQELGQPFDPKDWKLGECEPIW